MSFSNDVKNELLNLVLSPCCKYAQNCGLLLFGRIFSANRLSFLTENAAIAAAYCDAAEYFSGIKVFSEETQGGRYKIDIRNREILEKVLKKTGMSGDSFKLGINFANIPNSSCRTYFLRGAFLACGTVANPEKEYHLEFAVSSKELCGDLIKLFDKNKPTPKIMQRNGYYVAYFKNSYEIEDTLTLMGANESVMEFMRAKVVKDIRNTVNRKVNFENANLARTIVSASKQYEAIEYLKENPGFDSLPEKLQEIARLRYENRELSSAELSRLLSESLTVSGVNHRLKRLIKLAEDMRK